MRGLRDALWWRWQLADTSTKFLVFVTPPSLVFFAGFVAASLHWLDPLTIMLIWAAVFIPCWRLMARELAKDRRRGR